MGEKNNFNAEAEQGKAPSQLEIAMERANQIKKEKLGQMRRDAEEAVEKEFPTPRPSLESSPAQPSPNPEENWSPENSEAQAINEAGTIEELYEALNQIWKIPGNFEMTYSADELKKRIGTIMEDPTVPHIMQLMPKTFGIRDKVKKLLEEQAIQKIHDELKSVEGVTIETKNTRMIQEAGTIEGLLFCIESIGPITGSQKTYTPGELMLAIYNYIREPSKLALMTITGTYGIRQKVQELAAINDQNIDTMRLPGSLITELANQAVSTDQRGTQYHNLEAGYARIIPQEENQAALKKEKTKKPGLFSRWFGGGN